MNLEQQIFYNFLDQEAFKTIQSGTAALVTGFSIGTGLMMIFILGLVIYGINRMRPPK